jgi:hypothetical protein
MPEPNADLELLVLVGNVGLPEPLPDSIDRNARIALAHEISTTARASRPRRLRRFARRGVMLPAALVFTTAVAAAATGVATGVIKIVNLDRAAQENQTDAPLRLFRADLPLKSGGRPVSLWRQTPIPSSVHSIASPTISGVGTVQYWVADTTHHGICTAIRLPGGAWAGLQDFKDVGGALVGCRPTRRQLGWGALILSGFDYTTSDVLTKSGTKLELLYGEITPLGQPVKVRDQYTHKTTSVIDGRYFLMVLHQIRIHGVLGDPDTDLVALNASGRVIANEHEPMRGTPTTKCVGRYDVRRVPIPGTKRTGITYACRHYVRVIAK